MAISFQYNKTSLQVLEKNLKMRVRSLPTIKNKESALRAEVKQAKDDAKRLTDLLEKKIKEYEQNLILWAEFDKTLIAVDDVHLSVKKIAGVRIPVLEDVIFSVKEFSLFNSPKWYAEGLESLKELSKIAIESNFYLHKLDLLEYARKKTTQKVNLFEKVQIPGYENAILKIKRFMEDEENLSKSSQKIVKTRQQQIEEDEV